MAKAPPTPVEAFLAPLARIARLHSDIEGLVFWGGPDGWSDSPSEVLEAEEIAFYSEGLIIEGFKMEWSLVAEAGDAPGHVRLCYWEDGDTPPPVPKGWHLLDGDRWPAAGPIG